MKRKRRPRRLLIVCIVVIIMVILMALALLLIDQVSMRDVPPTSTPECVAVNPQDVGNMVDKGAMVVRCLEATETITGK